MATEPLAFVSRALPALPGRIHLSSRWATTLGDAARLIAQMAALWAFSAGGSAMQRACICRCPAM